jgi:hypothetical protein
MLAIDMLDDDQAWCLGEQAPHCYEYRSRTRDVYRESFEQWGTLCFQNEFSDVVWQQSRLYYKAFAEAKSACGTSQRKE